MYAVLAKKDETSWDVLTVLSQHHNEQRVLLVDNALASDNPLVAMETTSFRNDLKVGSVWDGTSFSGGTELPEGSEPVDVWDDNKRFSFLSNNVVVFNYLVSNNSSAAAYISEAFNTKEILLVKIPEDQSVSVGETHGWNGSRFV